MGKGHRDNHAARVKRGQKAFDKKAERRAPESRCIRCGNPCRREKLNEFKWCPPCANGTRGT